VAFRMQATRFPGCGLRPYPGYDVIRQRRAKSVVRQAHHERDRAYVARVERSETREQA